MNEPQGHYVKYVYYRCLYQREPLSQWKRSIVIHLQQVDQPIPPENEALLNSQYLHLGFRNWSLLKEISEVNLDEEKPVMLRSFIGCLSADRATFILGPLKK